MALFYPLGGYCSPSAKLRDSVQISPIYQTGYFYPSWTNQSDSTHGILAIEQPVHARDPFNPRN